MTRLLIANRGEVAVRIARAAADLGMVSVAVYSTDDADSGHVCAADEALPLSARGSSAYLDAAALVEAAVAAECDALHPGYGFLSENADFARLCAARGVRFIGPNPVALERFGDKAVARALAADCGVPCPAGTKGATSLDDARAFMERLDPGASVMVKALMGGGGRGMRPVLDLSALPQAFDICRAEAESAFGCGDLYVEQLIPRARHVEVQIVGDSEGRILALGDRDCSAQRRRQKLVEIAPAPNLEDRLRREMSAAAVRLGEAAGYDNVGTIEFLVDLDANSFVFIEANPRLQVEHTVTEEVTGVDLVQLQLRLATGETLEEIGLTEPPATVGVAVQMRINAEINTATDVARPTGGTLTAFEPPTGPGVRIDSYVYRGFGLPAAFDSMFAKLIVRGPDLTAALSRGRRALDEFRIEGVETNIDLLRAIVALPELMMGELDTGFVEDHWSALIAVPTVARRRPFVSDETSSSSAAVVPPGSVACPAPMTGVVVAFHVAPGEPIWVGQEIALLEAMKMQHGVVATVAGIVRAHALDIGGLAQEGQPLLFVEASPVDSPEDAARDVRNPDEIRPDLQHVIDRHAVTLDANRPAAVARRRASGQRTVRENLDDLFDPGSFHEYGALTIAAQRKRRSVEELIATTPADGIVGGFGSVNGDLFDAERSTCVALSYDFTVFAGTQGIIGHKKTDRILSVAREMEAPVVFFTEGGGGRPGDVDFIGVGGADSPTFEIFASMSGIAPRIGIASGRCFAGNAVLFGCCDITVATENANIGLGGPAMVEGGGLGIFRPEEIGPIDVQSKNGSIDLRVRDEVEAVAETKRLLAFFQGSVADWTCDDQRRLRQALPEDRQRVYDMRALIALLADTGSVVELRREYGPGAITMLVRIEGRSIGVIASNPHWLGGAVDADAADKAARFMQLCDAFGLPLLFVCDTPGFMVGPQSEAAGGVRHGARMFIVGASLTVPVVTLIIRKGYGLGVMAMSAGSFHRTVATLAWPSAEFGAMGPEGAVKLGYRRELDAIEDPVAKAEFFAARLAESAENGRATSVAQFMEIDAVIDPKDTRSWISRSLAKRPRRHGGGARRYVDTW